MTQVICHRIRLRPGSRDRVREWARTITERREEALATLRDEGVAIESAFLEQADDADHLVIYMRSAGGSMATGAAASSPHAIDAYHQQFKLDTWESGRALELMVDLETSRPDS